MIPPIEPRDDEPIEEELRPHLWRLRARLVTPPDEDRVAADLDRLHFAAREHAHGTPSSGREVVALPGARDQGLAWTRVGQVAAALLLAVAVGGGLSFGTSSTSDPVGADGAPGPTGSLLESGEHSDADASDPTVAAADDGLEDEGQRGLGSPEGAGDGDAADPLPGDVTAAGTDPATSGEDAAGSGPAGSGAPTSPAPVSPGETSPPPASGAPASDEGASDEGASGGDESDEGASEDDESLDPPAGEEIIAAPDPGELDGFGGERPCPDGSDSDDCLAADEESDGDDAGGDEARPAPEQPESPSQPTTPTTG